MKGQYCIVLKINYLQMVSGAEHTFWSPRQMSLPVQTKRKKPDIRSDCSKSITGIITPQEHNELHIKFMQESLSWIPGSCSSRGLIMWITASALSKCMPKGCPPHKGPQPPQTLAAKVTGTSNHWGVYEWIAINCFYLTTKPGT